MQKHFLPINCSAYGQTDTGRARDHNEDNIRLNQEHSLYILADGMGGHEAGEVASKIAIDTIEEVLSKPSKSSNNNELAEISNVSTAVAQTNIKINQANDKLGVTAGKGMGTTLVACWFLPNEKASIIFHVGDSRAYSYYQQDLKQLTKDHSLLQLWKDNYIDGKQPAANVLTKALGPYSEVEADIALYPATKGEKILLCSDGLSTMVSDEQILEVLSNNEDSINEAVEQLIFAANEAGGEDNVSVIIVEYS